LSASGCGVTFERRTNRAHVSRGQNRTGFATTSAANRRSLPLLLEKPAEAAASQGPICRASPSRSIHDVHCECTKCLRKASNFDRVSQQADLPAAHIICCSKLCVVVFARPACRQCVLFTAMTRSLCYTEKQQTICRENQNPLYAFWPRHVCCAPCTVACNELHSYGA